MHSLSTRLIPSHCATHHAHKTDTLLEALLLDQV